MARAFLYFSMFVYIPARFLFALIGGNLRAQSTGSHREVEFVELKLRAGLLRVWIVFNITFEDFITFVVSYYICAREIKGTEKVSPIHTLFHR